MKTYKGLIENLPPNGIYVFGSNTQGRHGKGSALLAKEKFGAIYGEARGFQGQSYAICTKDLTTEKHPSITATNIMMQIATLYLRAKKEEHKNKEFYVAYQGEGNNLNGYTPLQMARMFAIAQNGEIPENIIFEEKFAELVKNNLPTNELIVIINGSRQFEDYALLEEKCYEILGPYFEKGTRIIIRQGTARGADTLAIRFARENNLECQHYKPDWSTKYGGLQRNIEMIKGKNGDKPADILISFNMGTPGTEHTLRYMRENTVFTSVYEIKC